MPKVASPTTAGLRPASPAARPLAELLARLPELHWYAGPTTVAVTGITHDSRAVQPGDLYAALPGFHAHGADFTAAAAQAGAVAVLTDPMGADRAASAGLPVLVAPAPRELLGAVAAWTYGDPASALCLLGVTGTNGKTTTAYLLEAGLRAAGHVTGLVGTIETRVAGTAVPSARTTPEATDLQATFAVMRERGATAVAMEVSSHALALHRVDGTRFDVAAFTNLSQDHLDFHHDLEDYFAAKARLFTPALADRGVVLVDDGYGERLASRADVPITTVSATASAAGGAAEWRAAEVQPGPAGSRFTVLGPRGLRAEAATRLPGSFNVSNALLAVVTLVGAGVPLPVAVEGVASCAAVPGRMEAVDAGQPFRAIVDYAHTPEAVRSALAALRGGTAGRLIAVLGCGGDRDREKRPLMGEAAAAQADVVIVTDDNPRSEDPAAIRAAVLAGARAAAGASVEVVEVAGRGEAIAEAVRRARAGDTVLLAGKGHEQGQEVAGTVHPFDDREVLRTALGEAVP